MEGAGRGRERDKNTDEKAADTIDTRATKRPGAICPRSPVLTHSGHTESLGETKG